MIEEDTQAVLKCFDETGMNEDMQGDNKEAVGHSDWYREAAT